MRPYVNSIHNNNFYLNIHIGYYRYWSIYRIGIYKLLYNEHNITWMNVRGLVNLKKTIARYS